MAHNEDLKGRAAAPGSDYYRRVLPQTSAQEQAWPPMPRVPANDNDLNAFSRVALFVSRHLYWVVPTSLLACLSFTLLQLR